MYPDSFRLTPITLAISLALASTSIFNGCNRIDSRTPEEHIQQAKDLQSQGDLKGSILELKNAVQKDPNNAQARWLLGQAYIRFKLGDSALKELEKAKQLGVSSDSLQPHIVKALLLTREYQRVLNEVQPDPAASPKVNASAQQTRADALMGLGKIPEACDLYKSSIQLDPSLASSFIGMGLCEFINGRTDSALENVQQAIRLDPQNPDNWLALASFEKTLGKQEESLKAFDKALSIDKTNLDALSGRATILVALNRSDEAKINVEKLRALYPNHYLSKYLESLIAFQSKDLSKARTLLEGNLKIAPNHIDSLILLGSTYLQTKDYELAKQTFNAALSLRSASIPIRTLLAHTDLLLKQPKAALDIIGPVLQTPNADATHFGLAGEALQQLGRHQEAQDMFNRAMSRSPKSSIPKLALGNSMILQGQLDSGLDLLKNVAQTDTSPEADLSLARTYLGNQKPRAALDALAIARKKAPKNIEALLLSGAAYAQAGDYKTAIKFYEDVLKLEPLNLAATLTSIELIARSGNKNEAARRLDKALEAQPKNEHLLLVKAYFSREAGNTTDERVLIERAATSNPDSIRPKELLVQLELAARNPQKALSIAQEAAYKLNNNSRAQLLLSNTQLATGQLTDAISGFKRLIANSPRNADLHYKLGMAQMGLGQFDAARKSFQSSLELAPDSRAVLVALGNTEINSRRLDAASLISHKLTELYPGHPAGLILQGDIALVRNAATEAVASYEKAMSIKPAGIIASKLSQAHRQAKNLRQAESILASWITQHPNDLDIRAELAEILVASGRSADAIKQYEYISKQDTANAAILNNLASLYHLARQPKALEAAKAAKKLAPDSAVVLDTLGWILVTSGNLNEGKSELEKAVRLAPASPSIRYHFAYSLAKTGENQRAKNELRNLLNKNASFPERNQAQALHDSL